LWSSDCSNLSSLALSLRSVLVFDSVLFKQRIVLIERIELLVIVPY
jgi:hypothetical protein